MYTYGDFVKVLCQESYHSSQLGSKLSNSTDLEGGCNIMISHCCDGYQTSINSLLIETQKFCVAYPISSGRTSQIISYGNNLLSLESPLFPCQPHCPSQYKYIHLPQKIQYDHLGSALLVTHHCHRHQYMQIHSSIFYSFTEERCHLTFQ